jgi:peptide deformylase
MKISRLVAKEDYEKVKKDSVEMIKICYEGNGKYEKAFAIAHNQISNDPLKFFCLFDGRIIINPEIVNHTKVPVDHMEGCMSYPDERMVVVKRWNKCVVKYIELLKNDLTKNVEENLSGQMAFIFQHEIDHLNGVDIYHKEDSKKLEDSSIGKLSEELYKNLERSHAV